jgi:hypothetical protein
VRKKTLTGKKESDLRTAPHFIIFILRPAKQLPKRGEINFISLPVGRGRGRKEIARHNFIALWHQYKVWRRVQMKTLFAARDAHARNIFRGGFCAGRSLCGDWLLGDLSGPRARLQNSFMISMTERRD